MATKTLITEADFLRMTFDGPEPDYVDGELIERAMPTLPHSDAQGNFSVLFHPFRVAGLLWAFPELRIRTVPGHYRTVDVAVYRGHKPASPVPDETPFIAIEIVSPSDVYETLMTKLAEYKEIAVPHVWIVNPRLRTLSIFRDGSLIRVDAFELPEFSLRFTLAEILS